MIRSAASKVMWVGRATVFLVGLAVILAVVLGVASAAFGANGGNFILGQLNKATAITKLVGNVAGGPALHVVNNKTDAGSRALQLGVAKNKPPIVVNANAGKAINLNADKIDGKDSRQFMPSKTYAVEHTVNLPANAVGGRPVSCDQGDVAMGGGYSGQKSDDQSSGVLYTSLRPTTQIDRFFRSPAPGEAHVWNFGYRTGTFADVILLHVVCADMPPLRS